MHTICKSVSVNDEIIEIPRLNLNDLFSVSEGIVADRELMAKQFCKENQMDTGEIINILASVRSCKPSWREIAVYSESPQGAHKIIEKALQNGGKSPDKIKQILNDMNIVEAIAIAGALVFDNKFVEDKTETKPEIKEKKVKKDKVSEDVVEKKAQEVAPISVKPVESILTDTVESKKAPVKDIAYYGMKKPEKKA